MATYAGSLPGVECAPRAQEWCEAAPAPVSALTVIKNAPGMFYGVAVSAAGTITVFDNASAASGKVLYTVVLPGPDNFTPAVPIIARLGITVNSTVVATVYYS